jgi:hypothetical protein
MKAAKTKAVGRVFTFLIFFLAALSASASIPSQINPSSSEALRGIKNRTPEKFFFKMNLRLENPLQVIGMQRGFFELELRPASVSLIDPDGRKDFTLPNGQIDTSQVHGIGDFLDVMTTDFPYAVYKGVTGIPGQVAANGRRMRAEAFQGMSQGDILFSPAIYGAGAAYEFGGGALGGLAQTPEHLFEAAKFHVREAGFLGEVEQQRTNLENEIFKAQGDFIFNNVGNISGTLWNNKTSILQSTVSGRPASIQINESLAQNLKGSIDVGGVEIPTLQLMGLYHGGTMRAQIASEAISSLTGSPLSRLSEKGLAAGIGLANIYGAVRGFNSDLHDRFDSYPNITSGSSVSPLGPPGKRTN